MIKKTRVKFAVIIIISLMSLLAILLINLNMTMDRTKSRNTNEILDILVKNYEQTIPQKIINSNEFFIIKIDHKNEIMDVVFGQEELTSEEVSVYKDKAMSLKSKRSEIEEFRYLIQKTNYGHIIAFVNTEAENIMLGDLRDSSIKIAIVGTIIIVLLSFWFSKIIVRPMEEAMMKQKNFVSDASHELKTPLAIIKINSTLLKNKPINYDHLNEIDMQVDRMSNLVNELLLLAKFENHNEQIEFCEFDLSKIILRSILQLEVIAFENNKEIKYDVEENIIYNGVEKDMMTMMDALIDNAIKYSYDHSHIIVDFKLRGKDRILSISNESDEMSKEECKNIFDGFYRLDKSRSGPSRGFGIGLSVVKNIVLKHGGSVNAYYSDGLFTIKIVL